VTCGAPDRSSGAGLAGALDEPVLKSFRHGTHRARSPEATFARIVPHARAMGITRIGNVTGLDHIGIPVVVAVRPNSRSVSVSQGKGPSLAQAMTSALMEAAELFHAEDLGGRTRVATFAQLSAAVETLDPKLLPATDTPLPADRTIAWIEGFDLRGRVPCWIPADVVHTDYTMGAADRGEHFAASTNGLASGNHLAEALSSALCEVIERDAVARWTAADIDTRARCRVDLRSVTDAGCRDLIATYERAGFTPRVWDVTSDIGVAAFVCDLPPAEEDGSGLRRFRGAGAHPSRSVALSRALTEAAQIRLTHITGIRDDLPPSAYDETLGQRIGAALLDAASMATSPRAFADVVSFEADDVVGDVSHVLQRLKAAGIERVVAVDLSRPELDIAVVRMVVPELDCEVPHASDTAGPRGRHTPGAGP
jgi:ribosomal protein S12 methylthiotransferase accessory factor